MKTHDDCAALLVRCLAKQKKLEQGRDFWNDPNKATMWCHLQTQADCLAWVLEMPRLYPKMPVKHGFQE